MTSVYQGLSSLALGGGKMRDAGNEVANLVFVFYLLSGGAFRSICKQVLKECRVVCAPFPAERGEMVSSDTANSASYQSRTLSELSICSSGREAGTVVWQSLILLAILTSIPLMKKACLE